MTTTELLTALCGSLGGSGDEEAPVQKALSIFGGGETDALGNGSASFGSGDAAAPHIVLEAHMDQVGLVVTHVDEAGFVRFSPCGGADIRTLPGCPVQVFASGAGAPGGPLPGVVGSVPPHLQKDGPKQVPAVEEMAVDLGLAAEDVRAWVRPGDRAFQSYRPQVLQNGRFTSGALDNRAGAAALLRCARLLREAPLACRVTLLFTTREEVGGQGAVAAAFAAQPDAAICVDVGFGTQPGVKPEQSSPLGGGAMIGAAPILDRAMGRRLAALARAEQIPYAWDVMGGDTGTNSDALATTHSGVRTALLSIPLRNMHTPAEVIDPADVDAVARLLAAYVRDFAKGGACNG